MTIPPDAKARFGMAHEALSNPAKPEGGAAEMSEPTQGGPGESQQLSPQLTRDIRLHRLSNRYDGR